MPEVKRGEIWDADLEPVRGSEQGGTRPVLVLQNDLGNAYSVFHDDEGRHPYMEQAIACFTACLRIFTRETFPGDWAAAQHNLGNIYSNLPYGEQQGNLQRSIEHYQAALQVYTREEYPVDWAMIQYNRGNVYASLLGENLKNNLEQAILCFQASLHILNLFQMPNHAYIVTGAIKKAQEALSLM